MGSKQHAAGPEFGKQPVQWREQRQYNYKVEHAVRKVKGDAGNPFGKSQRSAADEEVGRRAERAERQAVAGCHNGPEPGRPPPAAQQHDQSPEDGPDVKIDNPPDAEAVGEPFQDRKRINDIQRAPAEIKGEQNQEKRDGFPVGNGCQCNLQAKHQRRAERQRGDHADRAGTVRISTAHRRL